MTLAPREKLLVLGVLPLVVGLGLWQFVWAPIAVDRAELLRQIQGYRQITEAAKGSTGPIEPLETGPLAPRLTRSAATFELDLTRLEPEGDRLNVTLSDAAFVDLIAWLAALEAEEGVLVTAVQLDRRPEPGIVAARLTLKDGS